MAFNKNDFMVQLVAEVAKFDEKGLGDLLDKGLAEGVDPVEMINDGLTVGLRLVGDQFAQGIIFLPELIQGGQIITEAVNSLKDKLVKGSVAADKGTVLLATVRDDVHDIGKNLVKVMLSAAGYRILDLGKNVTNEIILKKVVELKPDVVGLSALLSTTMPRQKEVIEAIREAGIRDKVKIIVGGAPVTRNWAEQIGADGFAEDAAKAVVEVDRLFGRN
ncbi:MAG: corrinoid protein [Deltaproteobacteria bacterium]|nr:corrinoid protein [Deltaproteobacteria bacterium]